MIWRQGDVLIRRINKMPAGLQKIDREGGRVILAHGELTGHAHAIKAKEATLFRDEKLNRMFLSVAADVAVEHEEHADIPLQAGDYEIIHQREYESPEMVRRVAD